jgi:hypothetical protein
VNIVSSSVAKVTLNVSSSAYNGIYTLAGIVANETTFNITSAVDGIKTIDNPITLNGGTYTIKPVARGIRTISSSSTYATLSSAHNIIVNDGTYTITATGDDAKDLRHTPRAIFQVLKKRIYSLELLKCVILFYKTHSQAQPILEKTDAVKHDF